MKTKIIAALTTILIASGIGVVFFKTGPASAEPKLTVEDIRKVVTESYPGTITELEIEKDGKRPVYEVEIEIDGREYELKIDGNTGEVLKLDDKVKVVANQTGEKEAATSDKEIEAVEAATSSKAPETKEVQNEQPSKVKEKDDDDRDD